MVVIALGGEGSAPGVSYLCAAVFASSTPAPCIHVRTAFMPAPMGSSFKVLPLLWMLSWIPNMKMGTLTLPSRRCAIPFSGAHLPCVKEREGEIWQLSAQIERVWKQTQIPSIPRGKRDRDVFKECGNKTQFLQMCRQCILVMFPRTSWCFWFRNTERLGRSNMKYHNSLTTFPLNSSFSSSGLS